MLQLEHHETAREQQQFPLIIACDNWETPQNVGMAFRLADAFGVQTLWLGGCTPTPPNRKLSKTARSTEQFINFEKKEILAEALREAKEADWQLVAVEITDQSRSLYEVDFTIGKPVILVLGSEKNGLSKDVLAEVHLAIHIPMYGRNSSLNVATALAVTLGEYARQQEL